MASLVLAATVVWAAAVLPGWQVLLARRHREMARLAVLAALAATVALAAWVFPRRRVIELFVAMAALGALIEVLQMIPALGRDAELADWIADCAASMAVLLLFQGVRRIAAGRRGSEGG